MAQTTARSVANGGGTAAAAGKDLPQALISSDLGGAIAQLISKLSESMTALEAGPAENRPAGLYVPSAIELMLLRSHGAQLADFHKPAAAETAGGAS